MRSATVEPSGSDSSRRAVQEEAAPLASAPMTEAETLTLALPASCSLAPQAE